jgi:hypothetical protein
MLLLCLGAPIPMCSLAVNFPHLCVSGQLAQALTEDIFWMMQCIQKNNFNVILAPHVPVHVAAVLGHSMHVDNWWFLVAQIRPQMSAFE